jgi:hypothetical protein
MPCSYITIGAEAFGATQLVPAAVTLCLFAISCVSNKPLWFFLGLYLYPAQWFIWVFQHYFQQIRPDPICQVYQTFAFPSLESFYIGGLLGIFIIYTVHHKIPQPWVVWLVMYVVGIVVPIILVYTLFNTWWEVLFSMGIGFLASALFVYVWEWFLFPHLDYLKNGFPLWNLGYTDSTEFNFVYEALYKLDGKGGEKPGVE